MLPATARRLLALPNDKLLANTGYSLYPWHLATVGAPAAWDTATGSRAVSWGGALNMLRRWQDGLQAQLTHEATSHLSSSGLPLLLG